MVSCWDLLNDCWWYVEVFDEVVLSTKRLSKVLDFNQDSGVLSVEVNININISININININISINCQLSTMYSIRQDQTRPDSPDQTIRDQTRGPGCELWSCDVLRCSQSGVILEQADRSVLTAHTHCMMPHTIAQPARLAAHDTASSTCTPQHTQHTLHQSRLYCM